MRLFSTWWCAAVVTAWAVMWPGPLTCGLAVVAIVLAIIVACRVEINRIVRLKPKRRIVMVEIDATIDIDFRDGLIEGNFHTRRVSRLDMAVVLETVAQKLRDSTDPIAFVTYDAGSVRIG